MKKQSQMTYYLAKNEIAKPTGIGSGIREMSSPIGRHWHDFIEIELVTGGEGVQNVNGREVALRRGSLTVMRPIDHHSVTPTQNLRLINLAVDGKLPSDELLARLVYGDTLFFELDGADSDGMERLFLLIHEENLRENPSKAYINNLVECLLIRILRLSPKTDREPAASSRISAAVSYIHLHFKEGVSLRALADKLHYDPTHLSTLFKRETGVSFSDYLNMLRLSYAKELLISTDLKVFEVGIKSGFSTLSNFLRAFSAAFGESPTVFRRKRR